MKGRRLVGMLLSIAALVLVTVPPTRPTQAATIVVTSLADPDPASGSCPSTCTLRNALTQAGAGDTIQVSIAGTIVVTSTLTLTKNVTIVGPGASNLAIDGSG